MTKEDYREKFEEDRQEIELETNNSRMSRSKQKTTKRKSPLMPILLVIFIFIPLTVLIYTKFIYEPTGPVEVVEQTNDVVQVEKNNPPAVAEVADDEDEKGKKDEAASAEEPNNLSAEQKKELAAAQAAAEVEAAKAAEAKAKATAEQKAKKEDEEAKRQEEATKSKKTHTVQANETLYRIAVNYYNDPNAVEKIKQANGLTSESIHVGQTLVLP